MLVLDRDGDATLVVPELEAPRVATQPEACALRPWSETDGPDRGRGRARRSRPRAARSATRPGRASRSRCRRRCPTRPWRTAQRVIGPLRVVKDAAEVDALRAAAHAVDAVAAEMRTRPFGGRTRARRAPRARRADARARARARELRHRRLRAERAPARTTTPATRVIGDGDVVVCDFGGTMAGYCSDITRMFVGGRADRRGPRHLRRARRGAGAGGARRDRRHAVRGRRRRRPPASSPTAARRRASSTASGTASALDAHEDPYLVAGNASRSRPGHAFSIEPGIYFPGRFGMRLEDIVVATAGGPDRLNQAPAATSPSSADRSDRPAEPRRRHGPPAVAAGGLLFCWVTTRGAR